MCPGLKVQLVKYECSWLEIVFSTYIPPEIPLSWQIGLKIFKQNPDEIKIHWLLTAVSPATKKKKNSTAFNRFNPLSQPFVSNDFPPFFPKRFFISSGDLERLNGPCWKSSAMKKSRAGVWTAKIFAQNIRGPGIGANERNKFGTISES